ncbi:MAG TPA: preprotein translocase subunit YajC [Tissierellales bacterium]|nr:preprotein translocase subunit YajC [Tissierellales bacterium]
MPQALQPFIMPIALIAMMYFLMIRPQKKKEKERSEMLGSLKVGDEILTIGGIYGKIVVLKEDMLTIEVGKGKTKLDISKWAIGSVTKSKANKQTEDKKENDEK